MRGESNQRSRSRSSLRNSTFNQHDNSNNMPSHQNNRFSNLNNNVSEHELIRTRVSNTTSGNGFSTNKNSAKSNYIDLNLNNSTPN